MHAYNVQSKEDEENAVHYEIVWQISQNLSWNGSSAAKPIILLKRCSISLAA